MEKLDLLRKGNKFGLPPVFKTNQLKSILAADITSGVGNDCRLNSDALKSLVNDVQGAISNTSFSFLSQFRSISTKLKTSNCVLVKADKGEALIALSSSEYHSKILNFLHTSGANPSNLNYDSYIRSIRQGIHSSQFVLQNKNQKDKVFLMNPSPPRLYAQLKTHSTPSSSDRIHIISKYSKVICGHKLNYVVAFHTDACSGNS